MSWTSTIICATGAVYIIRSSPWLLTSGVLANLMLIGLGCVLSMVLGLVFTVYVLYKCTDNFDPVAEQKQRLAQLGIKGPGSTSPTSPSSSTHPADGGPGGRTPSLSARTLNRMRRSFRKTPSVTGKRKGSHQSVMFDGETSSFSSPSKVHDGVMELGPEGELPAGDALPDEVATPQPISSMAGTYSGIIWTVPASTWPRDQRASPFPPLCEGPAAISHRWHATLTGTDLVLVPAYGTVWWGQGMAPPGFGPTLPNLAPPELPPKVIIPLKGCETVLVREAVAGCRTPWMRQAPLEVRLKQAASKVNGPWTGLQAGQLTRASYSVPTPPPTPTLALGTAGASLQDTACRLLADQMMAEQQKHRELQDGVTREQGMSEMEEAEAGRQLLYGEPNFFFFADTGTAKEQWLLAMQVACSPQQEDGRVVAAARTTYAAFCASLSAISHIILPRATTDTATSAGCKAAAGVLRAGEDDKGAQEGGKGKDKKGNKGKGDPKQQQQGKQQQQQGGGKGGGAFGWVKGIFGRGRGRQQQQQQGQQTRSNSDAALAAQAAQSEPALHVPDLSPDPPTQPTAVSAPAAIDATEPGAEQVQGSQEVASEQLHAASSSQPAATEAPQSLSTPSAPQAPQSTLLPGVPEESESLIDPAAMQLAEHEMVRSLDSVADLNTTVVGSPAPGLDSTTLATPASGTIDTFSFKSLGVENKTNSRLTSAFAAAPPLTPPQPQPEPQADECVGINEALLLNMGLPALDPISTNSPVEPIVELPVLTQEAEGGSPGCLPPPASPPATLLTSASMMRRTSSMSVPDLRLLDITSPPAATSPLIPDGQPTPIDLPTDSLTSPAAVKPRAGRHSLDMPSARTNDWKPATVSASAQDPFLPRDLGSDSKCEGGTDREPPPPQPPPPGAAVPGLHGLNMVLIRLGYEFLRAPWFNKWLHKVLQNLLGNLKRPAYLQPLVLEDMDLGYSVPLIKSVRAVAGPANAGVSTGLWPQLALDIVYTSKATIRVSTKVELQKAGLVTSWQNTLTRLQGGSGNLQGQSQQELLQGSSPTHSMGGSPTGMSPAASCTSLNTLHTSSSSYLPASSQPGITAHHKHHQSTNTLISQPRDGPAAPHHSHSMPGNSWPDGSASPGQINHLADSSPALLSEASLQSAASKAAAGNPPNSLNTSQEFQGSGQGVQGTSRPVQGQGAGFLGLGALTRAAAAKAQHITASLMDSLARMPVQLQLEVTRFEGTLMIWLSPPPSDRLWLSFHTPPKLTLTASPVLGGRVLRYRALLGRISHLIQSKIIRALHKEMVFPSSVDIKLGFFASPEGAKLQKPLELPPELLAAIATTAAQAALSAEAARWSQAAAAGAVRPGLEALDKVAPAASVSGSLAPSAEALGLGTAGGGGGGSGALRGSVEGRSRLANSSSTALAAVPRPGSTSLDFSGGLSAGSSMSGSAADGAASGAGKQGNQRRGVFLAFRWRPWGGKKPTPLPTVPSHPSSQAGDTPPAHSSSRMSLDAAGLKGSSGALLDSATLSGLAHSGSSGVSKLPVQDGAGSAGVPLPDAAISEAGSEGRVSGGLVKQQSLQRTDSSNSTRQGSSSKGPGAVAMQSVRGIAWLGGAVVRSITNRGKKQPAPPSRPASTQGLSDAGSKCSDQQPDPTGVLTDAQHEVPEGDTQSGFAGGDDDGDDDEQGGQRPLHHLQSVKPHPLASDAFSVLSGRYSSNASASPLGRDVSGRYQPFLGQSQRTDRNVSELPPLEQQDDAWEHSGEGEPSMQQGSPGGVLGSQVQQQAGVIDRSQASKEPDVPVAYRSHSSVDGSRDVVMRSLRHWSSTLDGSITPAERRLSLHDPSRVPLPSGSIRRRFRPSVDQVLPGSQLLDQGALVSALHSRFDSMSLLGGTVSEGDAAARRSAAPGAGGGSNTLVSGSQGVSGSGLSLSLSGVVSMRDADVVEGEEGEEEEEVGLERSRSPTGSVNLVQHVFERLVECQSPALPGDPLEPHTSSCADDD